MGEGEFVVIFGMNGLGKLMMLKLVFGVFELDGGWVFIWGRVVGFIEVGVGFYLDLFGCENVYLNVVILGMLCKEIDEKFDDIVVFFEIGDFID